MSKESIEERANGIIVNAKKITQKYNENHVRCVEIEGLGIEPCSGTHVSDTSQIAEFQIRKIETKKGRLTVGYNAKYKA